MLQFNTLLQEPLCFPLLHHLKDAVLGGGGAASGSGRVQVLVESLNYRFLGLPMLLERADNSYRQDCH